MHDSVVSQIRAISQAESAEIGESSISPELEALVGNGSATGKVHLLDPGSSMRCDVVHGPVRNMLAVG